MFKLQERQFVKPNNKKSKISFVGKAEDGEPVLLTFLTSFFNKRFFSFLNKVILLIIVLGHFQPDFSSRIVKTKTRLLQSYESTVNKKGNKSTKSVLGS